MFRKYFSMNWVLIATKCSEEMLVEICRLNSVLWNDCVADGSIDCYVL
jgi:hypothetical protein